MKRELCPRCGAKGTATMKMTYPDVCRLCGSKPDCFWNTGGDEPLALCHTCASTQKGARLTGQRTWHGRPVYTEEDMMRMDCPYPPDSV